MITVSDIGQPLRSRTAALRAARLKEVRDSFRVGSWQTAYRRRLVRTDVVVVVTAAVAAAVVRGVVVTQHATASVLGDQVLCVVVLVTAWLGSLWAGRAYDVRVFASGPAEYQRVFDASWRLVAPLALLALLLARPGISTFLLVAVPTGVVALLLGRWLCRGWLHRRRPPARR